ncbi:MAG TPA: DUF1801 domain-containing protein [Candidatus Cybelea sp.]|jgi:uncharacterized protein YdhG (YjbR/CyaY superfamily)
MSGWSSYLSAFPPDVQRLLRQVRAAVKAEAPEALETTSYEMPAFAIGGKVFVWFGAFKSHIGFYPGAAAIKAFAAEIKPYKTAKGSVQFPTDKPPPADLIKRMVRFKLHT